MWLQSPKKGKIFSPRWGTARSTKVHVRRVLAAELWYENSSVRMEERPSVNRWSTKKYGTNLMDPEVTIHRKKAKRAVDANQLQGLSL